jgi:hypothetical protein
MKGARSLVPPYDPWDERAPWLGLIDTTGVPNGFQAGFVDN